MMAAPLIGPAIFTAKRKREFTLRIDVEQRDVGIGSIAAIDDAQHVPLNSQVGRRSRQLGDFGLIEEDVAVAHQVAQQLLARAIGREEKLSGESVPAGRVE